MAKTGDGKSLEERVGELEKKTEELSRRGGGMLSSADFRRRVIYKRSAEDEQYTKIESLFQKRDWKSAAEEIPKYKEPLDVEARKCFIIEPFDLLNVTPFSYDLSIGNEICSIRKEERIRKRLPYEATPGETVIVLTREFIALPPCYSGTVWPRFKLVRGGIFQSMVKIDPTWYGKLGVAMTNLSSRTIPLKEGMAFGTLVLYELSSETDLDLRKTEGLPEVKVAIPDIPLRNTLQGELQKLGLTDVCWVEGNSLVVRGLKKSSYEDLRRIDGSKPWQDTIEQAKKKWLEWKDSSTERKSIGMEALGMDDLEKLVEGRAMGEAINPDRLGEKEVTQNELYDIAVEYGKPFDAFARIPDTIVKRIEDDTIPKIQAEVEASVFPKVVTLTLTVLGFLSLIIAVVAFLMDKYRPESPSFIQTDWPTTVCIGLIMLTAVLLVSFWRFVFRKSVDSRAIRRVEKEIKKLKEELKKVKEIESIKSRFNENEK
ncbi:MAG TPA: hypothetical protein VJJ98_07370 [Sedimentisphaerales bacterium]|nr:hypothetical protein [Sedimentisphaerales bacterium]